MNINEVRIFLDSHPEAIHWPMKNGATMLHIAAANGDVGTVELLISRGAAVNVGDRSNLTPLHAAASNGHIETIKLLLSNGANINARCSQLGSTPLHRAVGVKCQEAVELLVESGADINAIDDGGNMPLSIAQEEGDNKLIVTLQGKSLNMMVNSTTVDVDNSRKPIKNWKELEHSLNSLMGGDSYDSSGRSISDIRESYMLQMIYFGTIKPTSNYYDGYFDNIPFSPITDDLIQKARAFQTPIELPGAVNYLSGDKYDPEYLTIPSGESFTFQRKGQPSHDMLICSVASCLKTRSMNITNGSASDLAFEAVQHYNRIPIVHFFSSLPYLHDHLPEKGKQLHMDELLRSQLRCIDGLLFHLYDILSEGQVITDEFIASRVKDFFPSKTVNKGDSTTNDNIASPHKPATTKKWWQFWK